MEFGNFSDKNFIIFFALIIALGLLIIAVVIFFIVSIKNENKFQSQVDYESTTTRIYIVDVIVNHFFLKYPRFLPKHRSFLLFFQQFFLHSYRYIF